jgi:predicted porin
LTLLLLRRQRLWHNGRSLATRGGTFAGLSQSREAIARDDGKLQRRSSMHKKLIVVAVAGALAAPVTALAQTTIYGLFNAEWGASVDQPNLPSGASRANGEGFNSGASRIGFRGEEKMGGGLAAWYQCESELAIFPRGNGAQGTFIDTTDALWCTRNSAVGLKGGFGNFFIGTWDSPLKRASAVTRITNETGWMGTQGMTLRQGTGSPNMSQRNTDSFNYDLPNFGGFTGSFQVTTKQATIDNTDPAPSGAAVDGRIYSLSAQWAGGPVVIVGGYTKNDKNRATGGGGTAAPTNVDAEDTAWLLGIKGTFGPVEAGFTYTERESNPTPTTNGKRNAFNLAAIWTIAGPHSLIGSYAVADDLEGNLAQSGSDTGATQYVIAYRYAFSKRTMGSIGYVKLDNANNGVYNLTDLASGSANVQLGQSASALTFNLSHSF